MSSRLAVASEVEEALARGRAVVALESTIVAHGMPYPANVETAALLQDLIREHGAVPATIAVFGGELRVGLDDAALDALGRGSFEKISRRDLPIAVARGLDGATTVSATMIIAALAGIEIFVTGGIGGVHRGAQETFDVSADLQELARTRVAVVCAGAKSILDIGLTLEVLETYGVPVLGFGSDRFPAFFTRDSGFPVDCRLDSPQEIAEVLDTQWKLGFTGGALITNPIPEAAEMDPAAIEQAISDALCAATEEGVAGKAVTPYLLAKVEELTAGASLQANRALVENNARLGARLAVALERQRSL